MRTDTACNGALLQADCCAACYGLGYTCHAFVWRKKDSSCELKGTASGEHHEAGATSGTTGASPSPSPARNRTINTRECRGLRGAVGALAARARHPPSPKGTKHEPRLHTQET